MSLEHAGLNDIFNAERFLSEYGDIFRYDEPVKTKEVALKLRRLGFYTHRLHSGWGFDVDRELIEKLIVKYNA